MADDAFVEWLNRNDECARVLFEIHDFVHEVNK
jgi:hypothetical protein